MTKKIIVSGMRPTGVLHLGNYHGALKNWIELQKTHECFFFVADYHALTTAYDKTENLHANTRDMVKCWLAAGLNPDKCHIYLQSELPQIAEINLLLGMITPLGWLLRNPSYKEQLNEIFKEKYKGQLNKSASEKVGMLTEKELSELSSFGFLGYPVLMASDILIHDADLVPVGQDQLVHLELTRDIAKKFNSTFKTKVLTEPDAKLTKTPKLLGLDGRKMSKSYNNTIDLGEDLESAKKKIMRMFTDPKKVKKDDKGHPEDCAVYSLHKVYNECFEKRGGECKAGTIGCVDCKKHLFELMEKELTEFNKRKKSITDKMIDKVLKDGLEQAKKSADKVLDKVKRTMNLK